MSLSGIICSVFVIISSIGFFAFVLSTPYVLKRVDGTINGSDLRFITDSFCYLFLK